MARFPTFDEYKDRPAKGITKCNDLLRRAPNDIQLLTTKAQLLAVQDEPAKSKAIVDQLFNRKPPIVDLTDLTLLEDALFERFQADAFPQISTSGPEIAKLWDNAAKSSLSVNHKLDAHSLRFFKAVCHNRLQDAQQSLIQLKALQPKNRGFFMAHAAITQMLSESKEDLHARLALMLAKKAVSEKFDEEKDLDVRVPGQIFALQEARQDLEAIEGRRFAESKHVHDALRKPAESAKAKQDFGHAKSGTPEWLDGQIAGYKSRLAELVPATQDSESLYKLAAEATSTYKTAVQNMDNIRYRNVCELIFLAISALVRVWEQDNSTTSALLQACFLGEMLLRDNQHIHEAKVILVYLYMRLDLASQAMRHWTSLSIKEIQFDTVGHAFLTRLSITHPHKLQSVNTKHSDPLILTTHALGMYDRCEQKLAETEASVVSHGQTGMLFDLHLLRDNLRQSQTRRILSLEQRSFARLHNLPLETREVHIKPRLTAQWLAGTDNRDFSAAFNYGYDVERVLHGLDNVDAWLLYKLVVDTAWCLTTNATPPVKDTDALIRDFTAVSSTQPTSLTAEEAQLGKCAADILSVLTSTEKATSAIAPFAALDDLPLEPTESLPPRLQHTYLTLDLLRLLAAYATSLSQRPNTSPGVTKQELGNQRILIETAFAKVQKSASEMQARVQAQVLQRRYLEQGAVWHEAKDFGDEAVKGFCADVAEAARSGWAGVARIKLP